MSSLGWTINCISTDSSGVDIVGAGDTFGVALVGIVDGVHIGNRQTAQGDG